MELHQSVRDTQPFRFPTGKVVLILSGVAFFEMKCCLVSSSSSRFPIIDMPSKMHIFQRILTGVWHLLCWYPDRLLQSCHCLLCIYWETCVAHDDPCQYKRYLIFHGLICTAFGELRSYCHWIAWSINHLASPRHLVRPEVLCDIANRSGSLSAEIKLLNFVGAVVIKSVSR